MFRPIHLLPQHDIEKIRRYQERWESLEGQKTHQEIVELVKVGAGKHFLDGVEVVEDFSDLKGMKFWQLDIDFSLSNRDNFKDINFSYSEFWHSKFRSAVFFSTWGEFSKVYNCEFKNCLFSFANWYGIKFEKVKFKNCNFVDHNSFNNCEFRDCIFDNTFIQRNIFFDCFFDAKTEIVSIVETSTTESTSHFNNKDLPELYKSIKNAYLAGEVFDKYRNYFLKQKWAETKYIKRGLSKMLGHLVEALTGYGVKPFNTLLCGLLTMLLFVLIYQTAYPIGESFMMSMSAFVGIGTVPDISPYGYFHMLETIFGICFFALFITVLANIWFSEK